MPGLPNTDTHRRISPRVKVETLVMMNRLRVALGKPTRGALLDFIISDYAARLREGGSK